LSSTKRPMASRAAWVALLGTPFFRPFPALGGRRFAVGFSTVLELMEQDHDGEEDEGRHEGEYAQAEGFHQSVLR
jgi:hypothetical protein